HFRRRLHEASRNIRPGPGAVRRREPLPDLGDLVVAAVAPGQDLPEVSGGPRRLFVSRDLRNTLLDRAANFGIVSGSLEQRGVAGSNGLEMPLVDRRPRDRAVYRLESPELCCDRVRKISARSFHIRRAWRVERIITRQRLWRFGFCWL